MRGLRPLIALLAVASATDEPSIFGDMSELPPELLGYNEDDASIYISRGTALFRRGRVDESTADFDKAIKLDPKMAPKMWQRGLSLYYQEQHDLAAEQFKLDVAQNPNDTEEAIWHFLSVVRGAVRGGTAVDAAIASAQTSMLQVGRDSRPIMRLAMEVFQGTSPPSALDDGGANLGDDGAGARHGGGRERFYADLYLGLWAEANGDAKEARARIMSAVASKYGSHVQSADYMWHLARVHAHTRGWFSTDEAESESEAEAGTAGSCAAEAAAAGDGDGGTVALSKLKLPLPASAYTSLKNGAVVCRIASGLWQLSGGHGYRPSLDSSLTDMHALVKAGFVTFDLADHYGPAEDFVGAYIDRYSSALAEDGGGKDTQSPAERLRRLRAAHGPLQFHTKWVPSAAAMPVEVVAKALDVSRRRMGYVSKDAGKGEGEGEDGSAPLDLVAFHWWDYGDARYLDLMHSAETLSVARTNADADANVGAMLDAVALTNFDTKRLKEMVSAPHGIRIISNQVSFSVVDTRPLDGGMAAFAEEHSIKLMCYGVLLGGLLSEKWLGKPPPSSNADLPTASLGKYYRFVAAWSGGDWNLFQELLRTLQTVAKRHGDAYTIANVAVRWVLQQPAVGSALLGMRLGHAAVSEHIETNKRTLADGFELSATDLMDIRAVQAKGFSLLGRLGDCGGEYRG